MSPKQFLRSRAMRRLAPLAVVAGVAVFAFPSFASSVTSATITGGAGTYTSGGVVYAKNGGALTLTVNTSTDTKCVDVSGAFVGHDTSTTPKQTWTFSFTAGIGDGSRTVTATARPSFNSGNGNCTSTPGSANTSFVLDNIGPAVTGAVTPASNAAGWLKSDAAITWTATDGGSGVASGPTPATDSVTVNTAGVTKSATATDWLGNTGTGAVTVRVDKAAPSVGANRTPDANANGWNNTDVTVTFTCVDNPAVIGSGIKSCPAAVTKTANAAGQSVSGTATDNADNATTISVDDINIDKNAPTLTGEPTTEPDAGGWYSGDVIVHWTAGDALSGLVGGGPADSTITSEGVALVATAAATDKAGNSVTAISSPAVKIDKTSPVTTASAPGAWTNTDVTVTLTPFDGLSGVAATHYTVDGGGVQDGTAVAISTEGTHTVSYWSVDTAGNTEPANTATVQIDRTAPGITHLLDPVPNAAGWNRVTVTVTFTCTDEASGIASCTDPQQVAGDGEDQAVTGTATDNAGNTATDPVTVSVDKTKPTASAATGDAPAKNANGWYNDDVTVTFTCGDALSGVDTCTAPKTLGEGADQSAEGVAVDLAGNVSDPASITGINVDKTKPVLHGAPTTSPGADGWYTGNVTIHWTCSDALSDIDGDCPADSVITGEGGALAASADVSDRAGNTTTATVGNIKIDRTPPTTLVSVPDPLETGWYAAAVPVTLTSFDALSHVKAIHYTIDGGAPQTYDTDPFLVGVGVHTVVFWAVDNAGNAEDASAPGHSITVKVDGNPPTITGSAFPAPDAAGWNSSDVTVTFLCSDAESGIKTCTDPVTVTADGITSVTGTAVDNGGNTASATVGPIRIDKTPPTITLGGIAAGGTYVVGGVPNATCTATDTGSGVSGDCAVSVTGTGIGTYSFTATATDNVGNVATKTGTFRVIYRFSGFLQPINDPATGATPVSIFKGGSTVPVKFRLLDANGVPLQAAGVIGWLTPVKGSPTTAAIDEAAFTDPGTSGSTFRWDATDKQYIYNWSTKGVAPGFYYRIGAVLDDGQTYYVTVGLR